MASELQRYMRASGTNEEKTMQATQNGMEVLVMAELMRLQRDHSLLERLYERLPMSPAQPNVEAKFLSLWTDVERRADRLEYVLDHMA